MKCQAKNPVPYTNASNGGMVEWVDEDCRADAEKDCNYCWFHDLEFKNKLNKYIDFVREIAKKMYVN